MRITQIGPYPLNYDCPMGGVEASVYSLTKELSKENQLFVIDIPRKSITTDKIEENANIKVFRIFSRSSSNLLSIFRLRKVLSLIRNIKPEICHIHTSCFYMLFIYILLKYSRIPVVVTIHGLIHKEKKNLWKRKHSFNNLIKYILGSLTESIFLSICPFFIVDTQYVADTLVVYKKQLKILRLPVSIVIPQGVQEDYFQIANNPISHHLLSVGAFTERKGHLHLINSMSKIKSTYPNFSLIIAGSLSDNKYFNLLQNRISELRLESNIRLIPNASSIEILNLFHNSETFILHSEEESQGIVFCEAMAAGMPIVATNSGGIPWIIKNGINGLLSDYGDIDTFADNLISLLKNDALRHNISKNNRLKSNNYHWSNISNEITVVYNSISLIHS